jgi:hypothetical protein
VYLVNDRENFHLKPFGEFAKSNKVADFSRVIKNAVRMNTFLKAVDGEHQLITPSDIEATESNIKNSIYAVDNTFEGGVKPYGWFVWKTVTYMGDASGGGGGTSGYTQKIYLARDGVAFLGHFQEEDFITKLASSLSESGYQVIVPEVFKD